MSTTTRRARPWRPWVSAALAAAGALVAASGLVVLNASTASAGGNPGGPEPENNKISLCHRTNAESNPYVNRGGITPSKSGAIQGHDGHTGPIFAPGMKADKDKWGDIIPPFDWYDAKGNVHHYAGLNWSTEGQAIFNAGCSVPVVTESPSTADECPDLDGVQPPGFACTQPPLVEEETTEGEPNCDTHLVDITTTTTTTPYVFDAQKQQWVLDPDNATVKESHSTRPTTEEECPEGPAAVLPSYASAQPATCDADGTLTVPDQPDGVVVTQTGDVPGEVTFTYAPEEGFVFPEGTETEQTVTVEAQLTGADCEEVLGTETVNPQPETNPQQPTVLGTQAVAPTAVEAGLATWPADRGNPVGTLIGSSLLAGGLVLLLAGGWLGLGRRQRGAHQA